VLWFFRCDFGCWWTRGNISHHLLELLLDTIKRRSEGDALQHDAAGALVSKLGKVHTKDDPQFPQPGQHLSRNVSHAQRGESYTISEEVRMNPHLFPSEDFHAATPMPGLPQRSYLLAATL
jgi:hypothetical protein